MAELDKSFQFIRPPNSFTSVEYAAKHPGMSRNTANHHLQVLEECGKVKKHKAAHSNLVYWTIV